MDDPKAWGRIALLKGRCGRCGWGYRRAEDDYHDNGYTAWYRCNGCEAWYKVEYALCRECNGTGEEESSECDDEYEDAMCEICCGNGYIIRPDTVKWFPNMKACDREG